MKQEQDENKEPASQIEGNKSLQLQKKSEHRNVRYEDENFVDTSKPVWNYSILYDDDVATFQAGTNYSIYKKFGSKFITVLHQEGFHFTLWAPNATKVSVIGSFNHWNKKAHFLHPRWDNSGIWEGFIPGIKKGESYKYSITGANGMVTEKGDPLANYWELRPATASITHEFDYEWKDAAWMQKRHEHNKLDAPWSVYEVHLASWMRPSVSRNAISRSDRILTRTGGQSGSGISSDNSAGSQ